MFKSALNIIDKWPRFAKVFSHKDHEVRLGDETNVLVAILMLGLLMTDLLYQNDLCIIDKSNSILYIIFYNIDLKMKLLKDIFEAFKRLF